MRSAKAPTGRGGPVPSDAPVIPPNAIIFAIGDIHGRLDLLRGVTDELIRAATRAAATGDRVTAVFLGDYIDRGADSRGVIDHLIAFSNARVCETIFLRGNHEQILLDFIGDGHVDPMMWLQYGGVETLRAYGIEGPFPSSANEIEAVSAAMRARLPPDHLAFLQSTRLSVERGDFVFAHAGLRPDRLLTEQSDVDLLWHRFFDDRKPVHGKVVVHGHTPSPRPVMGRWRIGIDTKAYDSGVLTVLRIFRADRHLLKVEAATAGGPVSVDEWDLTDEAPQTVKTNGHSRSQDRVRAKAAGGRTLRIAISTRVAFGVVVAAVLAVLACLYIQRAIADPAYRPPVAAPALKG